MCFNSYFVRYFIRTLYKHIIAVRMCFRIVILLVLYLPNLYYCSASRKGENRFHLFVMSRATIVLEQIEQARAKKRVSIPMERFFFFSVLFLTLYDLCRVYVAVGSGGLYSSRQLRTIFLFRVVGQETCQ